MTQAWPLMESLAALSLALVLNLSMRSFQLGNIGEVPPSP